MQLGVPVGSKNKAGAWKMYLVSTFVVGDYALETRVHNLEIASNLLTMRTSPGHVIVGVRAHGEGHSHTWQNQGRACHWIRAYMEDSDVLTMT